MFLKRVRQTNNCLRVYIGSRLASFGFYAAFITLLSECCEGLQQCTVQPRNGVSLDMYIYIYMYTYTYYTYIHTYRQTDRQTNRQAYIQTYRHTYIQTDIHTHIHTYIHTHNYVWSYPYFGYDHVALQDGQHTPRTMVMSHIQAQTNHMTPLQKTIQP